MAEDHIATVVFKPPNGPRGVVVIAEDCDALVFDIAACSNRPEVGEVTCLPVVGGDGTPALSVTETERGRRLRLRFPDTDARVGGAEDDRTLTGPAALAVAAVGGGIACGLTRAPCSEQTGLLACVDAFFATDGTCDPTPHEVFPHFTALPPENDYQRVCADPSPPCTGDASEIRLAVDVDGNVLLAMNWRGILVGEGVPIARLLRGTTDLAAFPDASSAIQVPDVRHLASFSPQGSKLPPIFTPQLAADNQLTLFGTADAPQTVLRISRRICLGGENDGRACAGDDDCASATCGAPIFDFATRFEEDRGPVLVARQAYEAEAKDPVPLDSLLQTNRLFAFVVPERIDEAGASVPAPGRDLNGDGDVDDDVLILVDRSTGEVRPIGLQPAPGRAALRVRRSPFTFPAVTAVDDLVAFLQPEPAEFDRDENLDGDAADTILRIFRIEDQEAVELTADLALSADAEPLIDGTSVVISDGMVFFRRPEAAQALLGTELVSLASDGTQTDRAQVAYLPSLSADGHVVAFQSDAATLLPAPLKDTNSVRDVFVHDRASGFTSRVSVTRSGAEAPAPSGPGTLNADGTLVALESNADLDGGTAATKDVFVHDRRTGRTTLLDTRRSRPVISADANTIASLTPENDLHIYEDGRSQRIARGVTEFALSADGLVVVFDAGGTLLAHDRITRRADVVSLSSDGVAANFAAGAPAASADGRFAAFHSGADNLVAGDTNGVSDVFVRDRVAGVTERVSVASDGAQGNDFSQLPKISDDGRYVVFESFATNLVPNDANNASDVFMHDRLTGITTRVSVADDGTEGNQTRSNFGFPLAVSGNGLVVAFQSDASNLVANDNNGVRDLFVRGPALQVEPDDPADLTADGDLSAVVLQAFDTSTGALIDLGPATSTAIAGRGAAFLKPEWAIKERVFTTSGPPEHLPLPVLDPPAPATVSVLDVVTTGKITDVNVVGVSITHGFADDLSISLQSPGGTVVPLSVNNGFGGANYVDTTFDDETSRSIDEAAAPFTGRFRPQAPLSQFDGEDGFGAWTLTVTDSTPRDSGTLDAWALEVESLAQRHLNNDSDTDDAVVHLFDGVQVQNLGRAASEVTLSEDWVAVVVPEKDENFTDFNEDGDVADTSVQVYNRRLQAWSATLGPGEDLQLGGSLLVFLTAETALEEGFDLNDDGDIEDRILSIYGAESASFLLGVTPGQGPPQGAEEVVLGPSECQGGLEDGMPCTALRDCPGADRCAPALVAFRTDPQPWRGGEANLLHVYDVRRGLLLATGQTVVPCTLEACDPRVPFRVGRKTVTFLTLEPLQGEDLNEDGDESDLVLQTFNLEAAVAGIGGGAAGRALSTGTTRTTCQERGPTAQLITVGSVSSGVCSDSGSPCAQSGDCPGGTCILPPGECLKVDPARSCDPVEAPRSSSTCVADEFCGSTDEGFRCTAVVGSCRSQSDCDAVAACESGSCRCRDAGETFQRLVSPLTDQGDGHHVFIGPSEGRCVTDTGVSCNAEISCPASESCGAQGTCEADEGECRDDTDCGDGATCRRDLIVAAAADADGDEIPDPCDNCPSIANAGQADIDLDGIGDVCDAITEPTATPSPTHTPTRTQSPSPTPTGNPSNTPTRTVTSATGTTQTPAGTGVATTTPTRTPTTSPTTPPPFEGDANCDGVVTAADLVALAARRAGDTVPCSTPPGEDALGETVGFLFSAPAGLP